MNIIRYEKRIFAYLVDLFLILLLVTFGTVILMMRFANLREVPWYFLMFFVCFAIFFLFILIHTLSMFFSNGRTLGSVIFGLRTIHPNLERLSFADCLCKCALLSLIPIVIVNGIYMLIIHTEKTAFDRLTKTVAVDWRHRNY